jgi:DNA-directed RNA polymerase subunit N
MLWPVVCFTCGKPLTKLHREYWEEVKKNKDSKDILDKLKVRRICCRRMIITSVDLSNDFPFVF